MIDQSSGILGGIVTATSGSHGVITDLTNPLTSPLYAALNSFLPSNDSNTTSRPKAYLNWILLNDQFKGVSTYPQSGAIVVGSADVLNTLAYSGIPITKNGYLYIWVINETPGWDVFFDNLSVKQYSGPITEETHYYPFGLTMPGISSKAAGEVENKRKYNGKEEQQDEFSGGGGLDWLDYGARMYDNQIGRWMIPDPISEKYNNWSPYTYCKDNPISFFDFEGGDPTPAQYKEFFLNYAVNLYEQAKSKGASTRGALTLVTQIALESGYATNSGATKHNNPYSLMSNGIMIDFPNYKTATTAFFNNLDKHWPTAIAALKGDKLSADDIDKSYHTGDYESLGGPYMRKDNVNNYDYGKKILGANNSLSNRFIKALDQGIADNDNIILADRKIISDDFSKILDSVKKGDFDGAVTIAIDLSKTVIDSGKAQGKKDEYAKIKSDLQNR